MDSDDDLSPLRQLQAAQPGHGGGRGGSDSDQSPPRRGRGSDSDQSPPRRGRSPDSDQSPARRGQGGEEEGEGAPVPKAMGLRTGADFAAEAKRVGEEKAAALKALSDGSSMETVVRDEQGRKMTAAQVEAMKEETAKQGEEKEMEWGQGIAQKAERERRVQEHLLEQSKAFARDANDEGMNDLLRGQGRWGDPMLEGVRANEDKKRRRAALSEGVIREPRPMYKGDPYPNRFGIRPGFRWDGVDRSTGWEAKIVLTLTNQKSRTAQGYKMGSADM